MIYDRLHDLFDDVFVLFAQFLGTEGATWREDDDVLCF